MLSIVLFLLRKVDSSACSNWRKLSPFYFSSSRFYNNNSLYFDCLSFVCNNDVIAYRPNLLLYIISSLKFLIFIANFILSFLIYLFYFISFLASFLFFSRQFPFVCIFVYILFVCLSPAFDLPLFVSVFIYFSFIFNFCFFSSFVFLRFVFTDFLSLLWPLLSASPMIAFPSRVGSLSRCLRTSLHFQGVHPSRRQEQRNELSSVASEAATHSCLIHALISLHLNFYKRPTVVDCVMCLEASV